MKYAWIDNQRDFYPLQAMCKQLGISTSGYADWKKCGGPTHWLSDEQLLALIRSVHAEFRPGYGSPCIREELKSRGIPVGRVERLMRANGIRAKHRLRHKATTDRKHALPVAPNLLDRQFVTSALDQAWTADVTYNPTREDWLYLAFVMDLYPRMIVGWSMDGRMTRELVLNALCMARFRHRPASGVLQHSDRSSQYCSHDYQALLGKYGMICSMSCKGNCLDNVPMESFFNNLKNERVFHEDYETRAKAKQNVFNISRCFTTRDAFPAR